MPEKQIIREKNLSGTWIEVCRAEEIDEEDLFGFKYCSVKSAVYNTP